MADSVKMKVFGEAKTRRALRKLDPRAQIRVVSGPLNAGASLFNKDAKARVKSRDLGVSKAIGIKAKVYRNEGTIVRIVGVRVYTKDIKGKDGKSISSREAAIRAYQIEFGQANRIASPFMRPAFRSKRQAALGKITSGIAINIRKEAARRRAGL